MTREELLDCLTDRPCDVCKFHTGNGCTKWKCVFEEPVDENKGEWIPISERLPEVDQNVLATTRWGEVTIAERLNIGPDCWFICEGEANAHTEDIVAWQPLPEPYKKEGE